MAYKIKQIRIKLSWPQPAEKSIVLLLHGEIPVEFNPEKPWIDKYAVERKEKNKTQWINDCFSMNPPGFNGDYLICSYSGFTTVALICNGVHISRIRDTGYPFWDILYKPTIYFKNHEVKLQPGNLRCFDFLDLLTINGFDYHTNIQSVIKEAFTEEYLLHQEKEIQKSEKYLFHKLDGQAGYRVGQVLLEAIKTEK